MFKAYDLDIYMVASFTSEIIVMCGNNNNKQHLSPHHSKSHNYNRSHILSF